MNFTRTFAAALTAVAATCAVAIAEDAPKADAPKATPAVAPSTVKAAEVKTYVGTVKVIKETGKEGAEHVRATVVVDDKDKTTLSLRDNATGKTALTLDGKKVTVTGEAKGKHFDASKIEEVKDAAPATK